MSIEDVTRAQVLRWIHECTLPEEFAGDFRIKGADTRRVITGPLSWPVAEYERAVAAGRFVRIDLTRSQIKHSEDENGLVTLENFLLVATNEQLDALRGTVPLFWTHDELLLKRDPSGHTADLASRTPS